MTDINLKFDAIEKYFSSVKFTETQQPPTTNVSNSSSHLLSSQPTTSPAVVNSLQVTPSQGTCAAQPVQQQQNIQGLGVPVDQRSVVSQVVGPAPMPITSLAAESQAGGWTTVQPRHTSSNPYSSGHLPYNHLHCPPQLTGPQYFIPANFPFPQLNLPQTQDTNPSLQREILPNGSFSRVVQHRVEERPQRPYVNQHPENDTLANSLANRRQSVENQERRTQGQKINQGNNRSNENRNGERNNGMSRTQKTSSQGQNECLVLLGDSNLQAIKPSLMSSGLQNRNFIEKFAHSGATAAHLRHYVDISLEKKPVAMIIHGGTNDIKGRNANSRTAEQIAGDLIATAVRAREHGVRIVAISGILITRDQQANIRGQEINALLQEYCRAYNFGT